MAAEFTLIVGVAVTVTLDIAGFALTHPLRSVPDTLYVVVIIGLTVCELPLTLFDHV